MSNSDPELQSKLTTGVVAGSSLGISTLVGLAIATFSFSLSFGSCNFSVPSAAPARDGVGLASVDNAGLLAVTESSEGLLDLVRGGRLVAQVPAGTQTAGVALTPDGRTALVTDMEIGNPAGALDFVDTTTGNLLTSLPVGSGPTGVLVSPDGTTAYVTDTGYVGNGNVDVIDLSDRVVVSSIVVGPQPTGMTLSPNGAMLYVADTALGSTTGSVTLIDTATRSVVGSLAVGNRPVSVAVSPDGTRLFVADHGSGSVAVIDLTTLHSVGTWTVPGGAFWLAVSGDGRRLWVTGGTSPLLGLFGLGPDQSPSSGTVTVLDARTGAIVDHYPVGSDPTEIVVGSDATAYIAEGNRPEIAVIDGRSGRISMTGVPDLAPLHGGMTTRRGSST